MNNRSISLAINRDFEFYVIILVYSAFDLCRKWKSLARSLRRSIGLSNKAEYIAMDGDDKLAKKRSALLTSFHFCRVNRIFRWWRYRLLLTFFPASCRNANLWPKDRCRGEISLPQGFHNGNRENVFLSFSLRTFNFLFYRSFYHLRVDEAKTRLPKHLFRITNRNFHLQTTFSNTLTHRLEKSAFLGRHEGINRERESLTQK